LNIEKNINGSVMTVKVIGRLDTLTAPDLEKELSDIGGATELVFDFADLDYISSAGLRVLLAANKKLGNGGKVTVSNVIPEVREIFEITGFDSILTIE
jgi:anti-sigma B factor antagonist